MFQAVRPNTPLYILHKGDNPFLETGYVNSTPIVKPKYAVPPSFGQQEMIVDITAKVNGQLVNYSALPAQLDIADTYGNGEQLVISINKEAMNAEVISLKQKSVDAVNTVDMHKKMIGCYENILSSLNPEYAEKQQQQEEINTLKQQMCDISRNMNLLLEHLNKGGQNENVGN